MPARGSHRSPAPPLAQGCCERSASTQTLPPAMPVTCAVPASLGARLQVRAAPNRHPHDNVASGAMGLPHSRQLGRHYLPGDTGEEPSPTSPQHQEAAGSVPPVTRQHPPRTTAPSTSLHHTQPEHCSHTSPHPLDPPLLQPPAASSAGARPARCPRLPRAAAVRPGPPWAGAGGAAAAAHCYFRRRD